MPNLNDYSPISKRDKLEYASDKDSLCEYHIV